MLLAIYSRALSAAEVEQNHKFGADANLPPTVFAGADRAIELNETITLAEHATKDRPSDKLSATWTQVDGPDNGVAIANPNSLQTSATFTRAGRYLLRLAVDNGEFMSSAEVAIIVNQPPTLTARLPLLDGTAVLDTGQLLKNQPRLATEGVAYQWQQLAGKGSLKIAQPDQVNTQLSFAEVGVYRLELTGRLNGHLWASLLLTVTLDQRPLAVLGGNPIIKWPANRLTLTGQVETGLGEPTDALNLKWEKLSGPGLVKFADETKPVTEAEFTESGVYELRLTACNRNFNTLASAVVVQITVNRPPDVKIGPAPTAPILLPGVARLEATVSNDGLPEEPGVVALRWTKKAGPGAVTFADAAADCTTASFSQKGVYTLQLTADDGAAVTSTEIEFVVHQTPEIKAGTHPPLPLGQTARQVMLNEPLQLQGVVIDNGLGHQPEGGYTVGWTVQPATKVTIEKPSELVRPVTFTQEGTYAIQLKVDNGFFQVTDKVRIKVSKR